MNRKPIPKEHFNALQKMADKIVSKYLKDPNVVGWSIRVTSTCDDEKILINMIPSCNDSSKYQIEIVFCILEN